MVKLPVGVGEPGFADVTLGRHEQAIAFHDVKSSGCEGKFHFRPWTDHAGDAR